MKSEELKDLAADTVREIQEEAERFLSEGNEPEPEEEAVEVVSPKLALFTKINFTWKQEDKNALIQLRAASERVFRELFSRSLDVLDSFYDSVRVKDWSGSRFFYRKDDQGRYVEDWDQLDGQAVEKAIFDLQREKMVSAQQISDLFLEAVFAKYISTDTFHEEYDKMVDGTIGDRTSYANRHSRQDRYAAYFRFYIWYKANAFQRELDSTVRLLERVVEWRIRRRT